MQLPDVVTMYKNKDFILYIYAYRKLSNAEILSTVASYKHQKKIKKLPTRGEAKVITLFGSNDIQL